MEKLRHQLQHGAGQSSSSLSRASIVVIDAFLDKCKRVIWWREGELHSLFPGIGGAISCSCLSDLHLFELTANRCRTSQDERTETEFEANIGKLGITRQPRVVLSWNLHLAFHRFISTSLLPRLEMGAKFTICDCEFITFEGMDSFYATQYADFATGFLSHWVQILRAAIDSDLSTLDLVVEICNAAWIYFLNL